MLNKEQLIHQATQCGILPADYCVSEHENPSWAILLLSFIGAQFVVWPFVGFLGALVAGLDLLKPPFSFILSIVALGAGVLVLRKPKQGVFVEQLAFNMLILGLALWALSLFQWADGFSYNWSWGLLGLGFIMTAALIKTHWVQAILGAAVVPILMQTAGYGALWLHFFVLTAIWAIWCVFEARYSSHSWSRTGYWFSNGLAVGILLDMALNEPTLLTGFYGGAALGSADAAHAGLASLFALDTWDIASGLLTIASAATLFYHWHWLAAPNSRRWLAIPRVQMGWWLLLYAVLLVLALVVSRLGILVLLFSVALATGRKRIAVLSMGVMLLQLSVFYYALQWTLLDKAYLLMMLGAVMACSVLLMHQSAKKTAAPKQTTHTQTGVATSPLARVFLAAGVLLALGATQYDVSKKENIIKHGRRIYVQLQPADPRSLMQGDYMALRFALPDDLWDKTEQASTAFVAAELDARGVASVKRLVGKYETLANHEVRLPIKKLKGRWTVVTDAYFFPEGKGRVFSTARFGELRALDNGGALLVGLADENLRLIAPKADTLSHAEAP